MKKIISRAVVLVCAGSILFTACSDNQGKKSDKGTNNVSTNNKFIGTGTNPNTNYFEEAEIVYAAGFDGYVNIRERASSSAKTLGKFRNGPEGAELVEDLGEWMKINAGGVEGYVASKYVQDTPTIEYTGSATASWLKGIWSNNGGYVLMIYDNGTWEWGYDYMVCYGTYIMQNNEVVFTTLWTEDSTQKFDETLKIKKSSKKLESSGETYEKSEGFMTDVEMEEGYGGYGCITEKDFKAQGKALLKEIEQYY